MSSWLLVTYEFSTIISEITWSRTFGNVDLEPFLLVQRGHEKMRSGITWTRGGDSLWDTDLGDGGDGEYWRAGTLGIRRVAPKPSALIGP